MANKALATRQKMHVRAEPSQRFGKARNLSAPAAGQRVAGGAPRHSAAQKGGGAPAGRAKK